MIETTDTSVTAEGAAPADPTPTPTSPPAPTPAPKPAPPPEPLDYHPELGEPCVYRDEHGHEHAAIITRVIDEDTEAVGLVIFPDEGHHRHARALPVEASSAVVKGAPGWYPTDA